MLALPSITLFISPSLGVSMKMETGRFVLREGPGVKYKHG